MGQKEFYSVTGWNVYSENNITKMPLHNSILKINIKYNSWPLINYTVSDISLIFFSYYKNDAMP